jgi:hypothetical protein
MRLCAGLRLRPASVDVHVFPNHHFITCRHSSFVSLLSLAFDRIILLGSAASEGEIFVILRTEK